MFPLQLLVRGLVISERVLAYSILIDNIIYGSSVAANLCDGILRVDNTSCLWLL